jgi:hypothetical protein
LSALTEIMRAVSLWSDVPSCLPVAIVVVFGGRLRLGVTLILAIVFADAMTVAAKGVVASPRPHAVDARVQRSAPSNRVCRRWPRAPRCPAALWSSTWTITTGPGLAVMSTMAVSAALHASVLLVPALALGGNRS